jgi:hypothetical protein
MKPRSKRVIVSTGCLVRVFDAKTAMRVHGSFTQQA